MNVREFFYLDPLKLGAFQCCEEFHLECENQNCSNLLDVYDYIFEYMVGRGKHKEVTNKIEFECEKCGEKYIVNVKYNLSDIISLENTKGLIKKFDY